MLKKKSIIIVFCLYCLILKNVNAQFFIKTDTTLGINQSDNERSEPVEIESFNSSSILLYLVGSGSNKSLSTTNGSGSMDFINAGESLIWNNYYLEGHIIGNEYALYIWAVGFGTTLKAQIIINSIVVASRNFWVDQTTITSGTKYNFSGINTFTQNGDTVRLKIKNIGSQLASVTWGPSTLGYIKIPRVIKTDVAAREISASVKEFHISQNYPNPFNPETTIKYQLPKSSEVSLKIYNLAGQLVKTLVNTKQATGYYSVLWNGKDDYGHTVASGVYLYSLRTKEFSQIKKMILVR